MVCFGFCQHSDVTFVKEFQQCLNSRYLASTFFSLYTLYHPNQTLNTELDLLNCKHVMCRTCMKHCQCLPCQRRERLCWAPHPVLSITSGFSNTTTLQRGVTTTTVGRRSCRTHENCMHAEQIIIIFYIFLFIFCSMYLVLFSIVLYRTIVTVYTGNIFLYNYLWQMHQIIHLSPVGCFTPARGKTMQKNMEVSGVNAPNFTWGCYRPPDSF